MRDLRIHGLLHNESLTITARVSSGKFVAGEVRKDPTNADAPFGWGVFGLPARFAEDRPVLAHGRTADYLKAIECLSAAIMEM